MFNDLRAVSSKCVVVAINLTRTHCWCVCVRYRYDTLRVQGPLELDIEYCKSSFCNRMNIFQYSNVYWNTVFWGIWKGGTDTKKRWTDRHRRRTDRCVVSALLQFCFSVFLFLKLPFLTIFSFFTRTHTRSRTHSLITSLFEVRLVWERERHEANLFEVRRWWHTPHHRFLNVRITTSKTLFVYKLDYIHPSST